MVILKFLLIVFVVFYLILLLGRLYIRRFIRKNSRQYQQQKEQTKNGGRRHKTGDTFVQYKPNEKKNIPKDEGDYVDYEEIK